MNERQIYVHRVRRWAWEACLLQNGTAMVMIYTFRARTKRKAVREARQWARDGTDWKRVQ